MTRAFRGISFTISLLAPLLAENNIQNYNEPMDYSKGDVSLQPFNNQINQETQPSANYNTQPNSMQTPMPNQNPYSQPTTP
ncbi:type VI secretion protein, partial [Helicobacter pylori]|nr:type VI secretion protein [Helicobacter pylori]